MTSSPSKKQLREFGLFVGFLFPLLIGWFIPYLFGHEIRIWSLYIGIPLIFLGLFSPNNLRYFYKKWIQIGKGLGFINNHLILGLVFIIVVQPIAFIMKLFGYDPLKSITNNTKSYREERQDDNINFEKIF
tara:strand:+ start:212 stop:604 length:393 start_codon:yes stop_codon:yes gene_type:complete